MADLQRYWQEDRAIERSLPEYLWIVSIQDSLRGRVGGSIAEVAAGAAARLLHGKSHRVADDNEIRMHQLGEDVTKRAAVEEDLRKQGVAVVAVNRK